MRIFCQRWKGSDQLLGRGGLLSKSRTAEFPISISAVLDSIRCVSAPDLKAKLRDVSHQPGVYLMKDRLGSIIYVGKARDLKKRLSSYFLASRKMRADLKTRALIDSIHDFETHEVRSEAEALLLEGKLIKDYRPRYNIAFRDDKRFLLVKMHPEEPWPRFHLTRLKTSLGESYFGGSQVG